MLEFLESLLPLLKSLIFYFLGYIVAVAETKKRFNIPKGAKSAKDLEVHNDGNEYGTT